MAHMHDAANAQAICEAVGRPNMRFVPLQNVEWQAVAHLAERGPCRLKMEPADCRSRSDGSRSASSRNETLANRGGIRAWLRNIHAGSCIAYTHIVSSDQYSG